MAINTTPSRYEGFIFDGENSRTYGVYVTDVKVFGAPTRDVEMLTIPGRNGEFALDKGRFNNIEVVYTCAFSPDTQSDFNTGIADFRNWLASKKGYKTLSDEINTTEYRKAVFKDGLDVPTLNKKTGTFEVKFDCKPQRWLTSGETPVAVNSGDTITNPTLFDASPVLQVDGYGEIGIGGETIAVHNEPYGDVLLANATNKTDGAVPLDNANYGLLNTGDDINVSSGGGLVFYVNKAPHTSVTIDSCSATLSGDITGNVAVSGAYSHYTVLVNLDPVTFTKGTSSTNQVRVAVVVEFSENGSTYTYTGNFLNTFEYDALTKTVEFKRVSLTPPLPSSLKIAWDTWRYPDIYGDSTKLLTSDTINIDLDLGEAYTESGGVVASVNNIVSMPADLPTLAPGANTITYDNTFTNFKITPNWWKV